MSDGIDALELRCDRLASENRNLRSNRSNLMNTVDSLDLRLRGAVDHIAVLQVRLARVQEVRAALPTFTLFADFVVALDAALAADAGPEVTK